MTLVFFWGLLFGFVFASIGHLLLMSQYQKLLTEQADYKRVVCIDDKYYYIVPEADYLNSSLIKTMER